MASPPPSTAVRQFVRFSEASAHVVARQHVSTLLVLHLAPTHPALSQEGVHVSRVHFEPVASPKEVLVKQRRHAKRAKKRAAKEGDDDDDEDEAEEGEAAVMHLCTLQLSDGSAHAVRFHMFGDVRDTNPLLADGSLRLTAANCLGDGYLALVVPTTRSHYALAGGKLPGWSADAQPTR